MDMEQMAKEMGAAADRELELLAREAAETSEDTVITAPAEEVVVVVEQTPVPVDDAPAEETDSYEQKFKTLQGKYSAEVPRLSQQLRDMQAELEYLRTQRQGTEATGENPDTAVRPVASDDLDSLLENARFEGDKAEAVRLAVLVRERDRQVLRQEMEPIRQQILASVDERYVSELGSLATGWESLRGDPDFSTFLQQPAPFTGVPLSAILNQADSNRDSVRVAEIYNAFRQQKNSSNEATPTPAPPRGIPATLVAPPRTSGTSLPSTTAQISDKAMERAQADLNRGVLSLDQFRGIYDQYVKQVFT